MLCWTVCHGLRRRFMQPRRCWLEDLAAVCSRTASPVSTHFPHLLNLSLVLDAAYFQPESEERPQPATRRKRTRLDLCFTDKAEFEIWEAALSHLVTLRRWRTRQSEAPLVGGRVMITAGGADGMHRAGMSGLAESWDATRQLICVHLDVTGERVAIKLSAVEAMPSHSAGSLAPATDLLAAPLKARAAEPSAQQEAALAHRQLAVEQSALKLASSSAVGTTPDGSSRSYIQTASRLRCDYTL